MLGQRRSLLASPARRGVGGCDGDRGGQLIVDPLGCKREMLSAQLRVGDRRSQRDVKLALLRGWRGVPRRRGEQRMRGAHAVPADKQDSRLDRGIECCDALDRRKLNRVQVCAQRDRDQQPPDGRLERGHACSQYLLDPTGHRHVLADLGEPTRHQFAAELDDEKGVAERDVDDPPQHRPRHAQPEPFGQHTARCAEAQWPDLQALEPAVLQGALERRRIVATPREQEPERLAIESARHERQRLGRGRVEPLNVVDRHEQWRARSCADVEEAERDRV